MTLSLLIVSLLSLVSCQSTDIQRPGVNDCISLIDEIKCPKPIDESCELRGEFYYCLKQSGLSFFMLSPLDRNALEKYENDLLNEIASLKIRCGSRCRD